MPLDKILTTLLSDFPFALFCSVLVGMLCAFLGVYIVAKRVIFLGAVLTQISVLGLALTFLPVFAVSHTMGALAVTLLTVVILSRFLSEGRVPPDALLGVVFAGTVAARILVLQKAPRVEAAEIESLLRGDILFVTPELFLLMAGTAAAVLTVHLLFFRVFITITFDAETARTQGFRAGFWEMLFYSIAAVVISVATHVVGDIFVFGFLVIPPVAAMLLARTVRGVFLLSVTIGLVAPVIGLLVAFAFDVPSSPAIVSVALGVLIVAWLVPGSRRGRGG